MTVAAPAFRDRSPSTLLVVAVVVVHQLVVGWLALHSRAFIDGVWIVEFGRLYLQPDSGYSMYMLPDGSTLRFFANLGPAIAEWLFRVSGSLSAFRLLNVLAMLALANAVRVLAAARGVPAGLAWLLGLALLVEPTLLQSVVVGRADALALAVLANGILLADRGRACLRAGTTGWWQLAVGYAACVVAPSIWVSVAFAGVLALAHWGVTLVSTWRQPAARSRLLLCCVWVPLAVALAVHDVGNALEVVRAHRLSPMLPTGTPVSELRHIPELLAVSTFVVLPGLLVLPFLRPAWLAIAIAAAAVMIFLGGFYTFRIPHLLLLCAAAIALKIATTADATQLRAWRRLLVVAALSSSVLLAVRVAFGLRNEARPPIGDFFTAALPAGTRVADFSWDLYEPGRQQGLSMMRSYPGIDRARVLAWLRNADPDVVVRAADSLGTWIVVDDLDSLLEAAGYCPQGVIDYRGQPWSAQRRVRPVPSPLLWRLGMYRDHGPYALWARCPAHAAGAGAEVR